MNEKLENLILRCADHIREKRMWRRERLLVSEPSLVDASLKNSSMENERADNVFALILEAARAPIKLETVPTVPGWYWLHDFDEQRPEHRVQVVKVELNREDGLDYLRVVSVDDFRSVHKVDGQWWTCPDPTRVDEEIRISLPPGSN